MLWKAFDRRAPEFSPLAHRFTGTCDGPETVLDAEGPGDAVAFVITSLRGFRRDRWPGSCSVRAVLPKGPGATRGSELENRWCQAEGVGEAGFLLSSLGDCVCPDAKQPSLSQLHGNSWYGCGGSPVSVTGPSCSASACQFPLMHMCVHAHTRTHTRTHVLTHTHWITGQLEGEVHLTGLSHNPRAYCILPVWLISYTCNFIASYIKCFLQSVF